MFRQPWVLGRLDGHGNAKDVIASLGNANTYNTHGSRALEYWILLVGGDSNRLAQRVKPDPNRAGGKVVGREDVMREEKH